MYVWLHVLATERPSYPSCPPLLCLLNQMVPSFLAVPGYLTPQPTVAQDPGPRKWFITQREREREAAVSSNLSSPPSWSFSPSSLSTPSTLHASPITFWHNLWKNTNPLQSSVLPYHFIWNLLLDFLSYLCCLHSFFVYWSWRTQGSHSWGYVFLITSQ